VVIGERGLAQGRVEYKPRDATDAELVALDTFAEFLAARRSI
jgi:hypothetical protein